MPRKPYPPYPKNAPGPFYVECDVCIFCEVPSIEAPDLITHDRDGGHHCYFQRQPSTPDELDQAISACAYSCVSAVRYAGDDPKILKRLQNMRGADLSDVLRDAQPDKDENQPIPDSSLTVREKLARARQALRRCCHPLWDRQLDE